MVTFFTWSQLLMSTLLRRYPERDSALSRLLDHAARLERLQRILTPALPPQCASACRVANLKDDVLTIKAQGSAIAVRLKQMVPSLLEHFARAGHCLQRIQIKVGVPEPVVRPVPPPARVLSQAARVQIETFAATLPPEAPLRASLEMLVRRG